MGCLVSYLELVQHCQCHVLDQFFIGWLLDSHVVVEVFEPIHYHPVISEQDFIFLVIPFEETILHVFELYIEVDRLALLINEEME